MAAEGDSKTDITIGRGSALAQLCSLFLDLLFVVSISLLRSIYLGLCLICTSSKAKEGDEAGGAVMYEGKVWHERRKPVVHTFEYDVRYALLNLDVPPAWFTASHHMTACEARSIAATTGPVHLLTMPTSMGYEQNPLSVYYCYDKEGQVAKCIAELYVGGSSGSLLERICPPPISQQVTNTPWAERVTFLFAPGLDFVGKPLHVSPFMDMKGVWQMRATPPGRELELWIVVQHPVYGSYFQAILKAKRVNGVVDPKTFTWLMPHKVAFWIYWQALLLLWKGVSFIPHPKYIDGNAYRERAQLHTTHSRPSPTKVGDASRNSVVGCPMTSNSTAGSSQRFCTWRDAPGYPWR